MWKSEKISLKPVFAFFFLSTLLKSFSMRNFKKKLSFHQEERTLISAAYRREKLIWIIVYFFFVKQAEKHSKKSFISSPFCYRCVEHSNRLLKLLKIIEKKAGKNEEFSEKKHIWIIIFFFFSFSFSLLSRKFENLITFFFW